jgi:hypothetical protein
MVYETDFYTTRRPYRSTTPSLSTYTITSEPSRQVRILPGIGKVHVVHSYDRIVPYVGHKRLTVVTTPPVCVRVRPSVLYREFDRIENKMRPISYKSYTNDYLNSQSSVRIVYVRNPISSSYPVLYKPSTLYSSRYYPTYSSYSYYPSYLSDLSYYFSSPYVPLPTTRNYLTYRYFYPSYRWNDLALYPSWRYDRFSRDFDDETRYIRAQSAALLHRIHDPIPRKVRSFPLPYVSRYDEYPARLSNDNYIHRMLISSPSSKSESTIYYTDPVKKYFGLGRLACVSFAGERAQPRRRNVYAYDDPVKNDIQLLSYYIAHFRNQKAANLPSKADEKSIEEKPKAEITEITS